MKMLSIRVFLACFFFFLFNLISCIKDISKCSFYDKRNSNIKQYFYIPTADVSVYRSTIEKMIKREFNILNEKLTDEKYESKDDDNVDNITNLEDIKKKEEMEKNKEMKEKLLYIEKYRDYVRNILKNIEFKCESVKDYENKIKCNLCIYTELINNKHIRQGQVIQIFMNECMYGFYFYDNMNQYCENNDMIKKLSDKKSNAKIDDIYLNITKDVVEGNTNKIIFFRQESSKYHPVCYVSE